MGFRMSRKHQVKTSVAFEIVEKIKQSGIIFTSRYRRSYAHMNEIRMVGHVGIEKLICLTAPAWLLNSNTDTIE